tara:strand:- start:93 stop:419 length:327 start_codon:yes stop_codon:yes gene_type:complete
MTPIEIIEMSAAMFRTRPDALVSRASARNIGQARAAAVFVLREHRQTRKLRFSRIAILLKRDTKTIPYWSSKAACLRDASPSFRLATDALLMGALCPPRHNHSPELEP